MNHLTDEELQLYLQGAAQEDRTRMKRHLEQCAGCRDHLLAYRHLDEAIGAAPQNGFSGAFEAAVMDRVGKLADRSRSRTDYIVLALAIAGFAIIIVCCYFSLQFSGILMPSLHQVGQTVETLLGDSTSSTPWPLLLLFSLAILVCFGALDRYAWRQKWPNSPHLIL